MVNTLRNQPGGIDAPLGPGLAVTRRKFLMGVAGAAAAGLGLAACGAPGPASKRSSASSGTHQPLTVLTLGTGIFGSPFTALTPTFEHVSGATVKLVTMGYTQEVAQENAIFVSHSSEFDVLQVDPSLLPGFASGGHLAPIEPYLSSGFLAGYKADVPETLLSMYSHQGTLLALATIGNSEQGQYNSSILSAAGLKVPTTWEEMLSGSLSIRRLAPTRYGYVTAMTASDYALPSWLPVLWGNGGDLFSPDWEPQVTTTVAQESFALFLDLVHTGPPGAGSFHQSEETKAMAAGLCAYNPVSWVPDPFTVAPPAVGHELKPLVCPAGTKTRAPVMGGLGLAISAYSKNKRLAGEYIEYFNSKTVQDNDIVKAGGQPCRNSAWEKNLDAEPWFPSVYENLKFARLRPPIPPYAQIQSQVGTLIVEAATGTSSPRAALASAQTTMASIMRSAGYLK